MAAMLRPFSFRQPPRLLQAFLVATILPAAALAWLGWRLIEQDRQLERQRVQDLVENTATSVTAAIERELGAIDRELGSPVVTSSTPPRDSAVLVSLDRAGRATAIGGAHLLFQPAAPQSPHEPPESTWAAAERLEFGEHDLAGAIRIYGALARSADRNTQAGALIRLARTLRRAGRSEDALDAYAALAAIDDATVLGDPADLMARWARLELLSALRRTDILRAEGHALEADLRSGRWTLDRTTALTYAQAVSPWRLDTDAQALASRISLADAVATSWQDWQTRPPSQAVGNGRRTVRLGERDVLVVWREQANELVLFAATASALADRWRTLWTAPNIAVALVDERGRAIVGRLPPTTVVPPIVKPASDTRLPWTVRVAATSTPADIAATGATRRQIIIGVLAVLAFLIPATGYLVVRAVHKDLALARQQAAFVAAVSHEFRSPLTSLSHLTALLRSDFQPTEERKRQYYEVLAHETDRLRRFVETLLDFGRIQAGAARYHLARIDLVPLVSGVVEEFRAHHAAGAHEVSFTTALQLPPVSADVEALSRAIWNLLENAAKYSPERHPIHVAVAEDNSRIVIRVSDEGAGIPATEQPFIFDQFFRGAAASQSAVKGTGVGLSVVRHIVQGHGGDIHVESAVGRGSTFTIALPCPATDPGGEPKPETWSPGTGAQSLEPRA